MPPEEALQVLEVERLLQETVKAFYDECKVRIEACHAKYDALFIEILSEQPAEFNEAKNEVSAIYRDAKDQAEKLYQAKCDEIEEGYQRYLKQQEEKEEKEAQQFDPTKGMPLNYEE